MSFLARRIAIGTISVSSYCSMAATSRFAFQWMSKQVSDVSVGSYLSGPLGVETRPGGGARHTSFP